MWLKISGSLRIIFWIIKEGSKLDTLLLMNISLAANLPTIFVECTAITAWIIAIGPYGNNENPFVKGAVNNIILRIRLKDVLIPIWVAPKQKLLIEIFLIIFLADSPFRLNP